ncbi:cid1 family poly A polymerase domain-containing protein [Ditylenchus destructor]|uniref:Cid1 family poly A polymerase domain-containing protein n=1 Tax=Ditylenchus destructor TaxID=166010 RepID=A0AAD4NI59_9BILA|nr:cid1 family poly A polymerase domain-containing protein [Ditylenchus destructor]
MRPWFIRVVDCCPFAADSSLSQSIALLDDLCEAADIPASEVAGPMGYEAKLSAKGYEKLTHGIELLYKDNVLGDDRRKELVYQFVPELENLIKQKLNNRNVKLSAFGSVVNGFGSKNSDLDMCLWSTTNTPLDSDYVLKEIRSIFVRNENFDDVMHIENAKIPIIKFTSKKYDLSCDICIENRLATYNSDLLSEYSKFDDRVPKLGLALKHWAKSFEINDASKDTISSYAYMIMLIHYLQRCPSANILPFLQEGVAGGEVIEGCIVNFKKPNTTFSRKAKKCSVGELFHNFFHFYNVFNTKKNVIQIRTRKKLLKSSAPQDDLDLKLPLYVQDPFRHERNLTKNVSGTAIQKIKDAIKCTLVGLQECENLENVNLTQLFDKLNVTMNTENVEIPKKEGHRKRQRKSKAAKNGVDKLTSDFAIVSLNGKIIHQKKLKDIRMVRSIECTECRKAVRKTTQKMRHIEQSHEKYKCTLCFPDQYFKSGEKYVAHLSSLDHMNRARKYSINEIVENYPKEENREEAMEKALDKYFPKQSPRELAVWIGQSKLSGKCVKCEDKGQITMIVRRKNQQLYHLNKNHYHIPFYKCSECSVEYFGRQNQFTKHVRNSHGGNAHNIEKQDKERLLADLKEKIKRDFVQN